MTERTSRILLIDDDLPMQFVQERFLSRLMPAKGRLNVASSGNEAIAYMIGEGDFADRQRHPFPSLIICDLDMKDGDGFEVLRFLQANPAWSVVPRVIFASSDDEDNIRTAYMLGASAFHVRPTIAEALKELLNGIITYWLMVEAPPVDASGKLQITKASLLRGARFPQPRGGDRMLRP